MPAPYWKPFFHEGKAISLGHLEPFSFACATPDGFARNVHVVFSNHVFTRGLQEGDDPNSACFDRRIFCPNRYADTSFLKDELLRLPSAKVHQTWEQRNYVFLAVVPVVDAGALHVFFELSKGGSKKNRRLDLWVESAYRTNTYTPPARPSSIRFAMLAQNIFLGRKVEFATR